MYIVREGEIMKSKYIVLFGIVVIILIVIACIIPQKEVKENLLNINYNIEGNELELEYDKENPLVAMYIENYGSVVIELYPSIAPNTVNNFISLIKSGFYDNNTIHRLVPGFVLQGGDPNGSGSGGPGYTIDGEFTSNGFENNLSHKKWIVSMARNSGDFNSAGSQFFICLDDSTFLDGDYASFGEVIDGFDVIRSIEKNEMIEDPETGKLRKNLVIKKALIDLNKYEYNEVLKNY
mgnify:CR=1 FL=1